MSTLDAWLDGVRRFVAEGEFDFFLNLNDSDYPSHISPGMNSMLSLER